MHLASTIVWSLVTLGIVLGLNYIYSDHLSRSMDFGFSISYLTEWLPCYSPSFFPISGETDEYMIFGQICATGLFIRIFIWAYGEWSCVYGLLCYEILLVAGCTPDRRWRVLQFGIRAGFRPVSVSGWRLVDSVFNVLKNIYINNKKNNKGIWNFF